MEDTQISPWTLCPTCHQPKQTELNVEICPHCGWREDICPKCGDSLWRDSCDVGVGIIYGPWGCPQCYWSENSDYDRSEGVSPAQQKNPDRYIDQYGISHSVEHIAEGCSRFGIPKQTVVDAFTSQS